ANDETRRFAEWLQTDEAAPAFKKYGWTKKGT
ncbi:TPA: accessory colonization factor AcfC, partial [Escherichia coli]